MNTFNSQNTSTQSFPISRPTMQVTFPTLQIFDEIKNTGAITSPYEGVYKTSGLGGAQPRLNLAEKDQQIAWIFNSENPIIYNQVAWSPVLPSYDELENKYCMWDLQSYYRMLENNSYEKITTYDIDKEKEITLYRCKYAGWDKTLNKPWNLLEHVLMHEGVKPHRCDWWGKTFTQRGNLKKHVRQHIHPDVNHRKRFKCRFCEKGYTERYNLKVGILYISGVTIKWPLNQLVQTF